MPVEQKHYGFILIEQIFAFKVLGFNENTDLINKAILPIFFMNHFWNIVLVFVSAYIGVDCKGLSWQEAQSRYLRIEF